MSIITPERAAEIRGELTEKYSATWLHHYHEAIEAEVLRASGPELAALVELSNSQTEALARIAAMAHNASTGPAIPDTYWEIRNIAQEAL